MESAARFLQLKRMLGLTAGPESADEARAVLAGHLQAFAQALVHEAAASDDVVSAAAACDYLAERVAWFGDLVADPAGLLEIAAALVDRWDSAAAGHEKRS